MIDKITVIDSAGDAREEGAHFNRADKKEPRSVPLIGMRVSRAHTRRSTGGTKLSYSWEIQRAKSLVTVNISTMEPPLCEPVDERIEIIEFSDKKACR